MMDEKKKRKKGERHGRARERWDGVGDVSMRWCDGGGRESVVRERLFRLEMLRLGVGPYRELTI